jgi:hypothetical protein
MDYRLERHSVVANGKIGGTMLEHQALWLGPWSAPSQPQAGIVACCQRSLCHVSTRAVLGTARQIAARSSWWPRLGGGGWNLEVHEKEDDSLLFMMSRRWVLGESWLVCDADRRRVGKLCGDWLRDAFGRRLAVLGTRDGGISGRWCDVEGRELGTFGQADQGVLATFHPTTAENPFVRMLLLATLLRPRGPLAG